MTGPARQRPARLAWLMLASVLTALGCAQLLDFKDDVPADATGSSPGAAGELGTGAGGADGGQAEAGGAPAQGDAGDGNSGGAGASKPKFCDTTPVGETAACSEMPDGAAINFPGGSPQGVCALGAKTCKSDGSFGPCMGAVAPAATDCSTKTDTNCDGTPDQDQCGACGPGDTQYCYDGPDGTKDVGTCMQGTQVCQHDASGAGYVWGPCAGEVTPATNDSCDMGNDATCNSMPNEGCDCIDGDTSDCGSKLHLLGNCAAGITKCVNGAWSTCSVGMKANDGCDAGDDATCNGSANEGCPCVNNQTQSCGTNATGCTLGTQTCQGGNWGTCANNTCADFTVRDRRRNASRRASPARMPKRCAPRRSVPPTIT